MKDRIFDETHTAIFQAVHPPYQSPSVFDWNQLEAVSSRVSIPGPPGSGWARIDYGAALDELDTLLTIHPAYTYAGRQLASVHNRIASMDSLTSWMRRLEDEFDLRLNRLVRVRNALTHGGPTTAAIVQSAQRFSAPLSLRALNTTLQAILAGEDPAAYHAEARERAESWRRDLPLSSVRNALLGDG